MARVRTKAGSTTRPSAARPTAQPPPVASAPANLANLAKLANLTVPPPPGAPTDSRSAVAYFRIRDLIVTLELAPGTALDERDLMTRLQLGRTPVREALRRLAEDRTSAG